MSEPTHFGAYEVDRFLGSGGFADVYLCYHPALETRVAVKVLHAHLARKDEVRVKFLHEAQHMWRADSDRVIQVTHVDQLADGRPYFVMRHADRGSLAEVLRDRRARGDAPTLRQTIGIVVDLLDCLTVLRDRNLVHRDLKPSNILVKSIGTPDHERAERFDLPADERLVLADFGLAKKLSEGTNLISTFGGTPAYMAPELGDLYGDVTWRADLFSIGVIAYEVATGQVPWPDKRFEHVREVDLSQVVAREQRAEFPAAFDEAVHRAIAADPMDRWDEPAAFAAALEALLGQEPVVADRPGSIDRVRVIVEDLRPRVDDPVLRSIADAAAARLDDPVRIGVIGGNRLSPAPLGLKLMGQRPAPGEASLLGSVVVRMGHGEPSLSAVLRGGGRVEGDWSLDGAGGIALRVPAQPWMIESIEMRLDQPDFAGMEVIDIPHAVLRRDRELVRTLYERVDVAVIGLPADVAGESYAVDEVLSLSGQGGPFALVGVRQVGSSEPGHPTLAAVVPGDDTIELKVLLGELLGGDRMDDCRASRALAMVRQVAYHGRIPGDWEARVAAVHAEYPALEELAVARHDLVSSLFDEAGRRSLHRLLGRRVASARLDADADTPAEALISAATNLAGQWRARHTVDPYPAQVVAQSIHRLEQALADRLAKETP